MGASPARALRGYVATNVTVRGAYKQLAPTAPTPRPQAPQAAATTLRWRPKRQTGCSERRCWAMIGRTAPYAGTQRPPSASLTAVPATTTARTPKMSLPTCSILHGRNRSVLQGNRWEILSFPRAGLLCAAPASIAHAVGTGGGA